MVSFVCEAATTGPRCDTPQTGGARGIPLAERLRGRERRKIDGDGEGVEPLHGDRKFSCVVAGFHALAPNGCRVRNSRPRCMSGGPAKEPNSNRIGTRSRAGGLDALRAASAHRRTLARIKQFRTGKKPRHETGHGRREEAVQDRRAISCSDTERRAPGRAAARGVTFWRDRCKVECRSAFGPLRGEFAIGDKPQFIAGTACSFEATGQSGLRRAGTSRPRTPAGYLTKMI
jgi:hypothetical protein